MYSIFEQLIQKYGVSAYKVAKETGVTQSTLSDWKRGRSTPKTDNMKKLADYFGVSLDYLTTGEDAASESSNEIGNNTERDLAKKIDDIIGDMNDPETSPLYFNGEKLDDKSIAILAEALTSAMKQVEIMRDKKK